MVKKKSINMFNMESQLLLYSSVVNEGDSNLSSGVSISKKYGKDNESKLNYVKVEVADPINNRDIILGVAKNKKGVYL